MIRKLWKLSNFKENQKTFCVGTCPGSYKLYYSEVYILQTMLEDNCKALQERERHRQRQRKRWRERYTVYYNYTVIIVIVWYGNNTTVLL